jgi:membrane-bound inhibitor of C-type lysozyme
MSINLNKSIIAASLALAAASLCAAPSALASQNKPVKAKAGKTSKAKAETEAVPDGPDADIADTVTTEYNCELGAKLTIFHNENDDSHIAIRWKKRIHRLDKVGTTTGARRFENPTFGLIWIGIPAKGMLLDSKLNRQLANECKNADQERAELAPPKAVPGKLPTTKVKEVVEPIVPPEPAPQTGTPATAPGATPQSTPPPAPAQPPQDKPVVPETTVPPKR